VPAIQRPRRERASVRGGGSGRLDDAVRGGGSGRLDDAVRGGGSGRLDGSGAAARALEGGVDGSCG
jgi:hypothetical protein